MLKIEHEELPAEHEDTFILYIRKDVLPIKLVIATALMAVARKIIVFDFNRISPLYIIATASVVLALGITYWLVSLKPNTIISKHNEH